MNVLSFHRDTSGAVHLTSFVLLENDDDVCLTFCVLMEPPAEIGLTAFPTSTPYMITSAPGSSGDITNLCFAGIFSVSVTALPLNETCSPAFRSLRATYTLSDG